MQQCLHALMAIDCEPSRLFITLVIEIKLDTNTLFEWQKHIHEKTKIPHYLSHLEFLNLHAQASEVHISEHSKKIWNYVCCIEKVFTSTKPIALLP